MTDAVQTPTEAEVRQLLLTCMDPRVEVSEVLKQLPSKFPGWVNDPDTPSTYVLRNAGGVATDDAVRSMVMVQRLAAPPQLCDLRIAVVAHEATGDAPCAMTTRTDCDMKDNIEGDARIRTTPPFSLEFFEAGADQGVRRSLTRLAACPFIVDSGKMIVRGFVYDTRSRQLRDARS